MAFSRSQMNIANHVNMYQYMTARGARWAKFSKTEDYLVEHDSMKAVRDTGVVTWYSHGELNSFNNAVAFAEQVYPNDNCDKLISSLLDFGIEEMKHVKTRVRMPERQQASFSLQKIQQTKRGPVTDTGKLNEAGRRYLIDKRFLSPETVDRFVQNGTITSDSMGNILFHWVEDHQTLGVDQQGVRKRPLKSRIQQKANGELKLKRPYYKGIGVNSASDSGFRFSAYQDPEGFRNDPKSPINLYVCEAPIESLSLFELNQRALQAKLAPKENAIYLSMSGLKQNAIYKEMDTRIKFFGQERPFNVIMSTNADQPGQQFIKRVLTDYKKLGKDYPNVHWKLLQPNIENADWNEMLEYQKTGQLASRLEKQNDLIKAQRLVATQHETNLESADQSSSEATMQTQTMGRGV